MYENIKTDIKLFAIRQIDKLSDILKTKKEELTVNNVSKKKKKIRYKKKLAEIPFKVISHTRTQHICFQYIDVCNLYNFIPEHLIINKYTNMLLLIKSIDFNYTRTISLSHMELVENYETQIKKYRFLLKQFIDNKNSSCEVSILEIIIQIWK